MGNINGGGKCGKTLIFLGKIQLGVSAIFA